VQKRAHRGALRPLAGRVTGPSAVVPRAYFLAVPSQLVVCTTFSSFRSPKSYVDVVGERALEHAAHACIMRYRLRDSQPSESSPEPPRGPGGRFPRSFLVPGGLPPPPSAGLSVFASGLQDQHGVPDCLNIKLASCPKILAALRPERYGLPTGIYRTARSFQL